MSRRDAEGIVGLWQAIFRDDPVELVAQAVHDYIAEGRSSYPPNIGDVRQAVGKLKKARRFAEPETAEWAKLRRDWAEMRARRRAAGLPETACAALEAGMSSREYLAALDRVGLMMGGNRDALDG